MDIIATLKAECQKTPSRVAFRNLGTPGDNVSVKYHDNEGCSPNSYSWNHGTTSITEGQARSMLMKLEAEINKNHLKEPDFYLYENGYILKRERGVVRLPRNDGIGVDAHGKWVLRDSSGDAVDMDKYFNDITERYQEKIGKPVGMNSNVAKIASQSLYGRVDKPSVPDNTTISGERKKEESPVRSMEGRMIHIMRDTDPDEIVLDGLTFTEAMERCKKEEGY